MKKARLPFVTANFVITADGRISTRNLTPADFSSSRDKRRLVEIRATCDAVLASAKTIATDNMIMGLPAEELRAARVSKGQPPYPLRVLVSNRGRIDPKLKIFTKAFSPIIVFSSTQMPRRTQSALTGKATVYLHEERVDLTRMLQTLSTEHQVRRVVCEGGAHLFRSLLAAELIDELHVTVAPRVFGGAKAPTLTGIAGEYLSKSTSLKLQSMEVVDAECFLRYRVTR